MDQDRELIEGDIEAYLEQHQRKELLRFVAVGSVDDGKSTLIGRLLHDTHGVYEDQLRAVERASSVRGDRLDLSLLTDGLRAEREQGITIDVAYRYFSTARRKFIIADTPGHVQYTRNMATGASTANVAIILIDARLGVLQQSRRHAYIASLLGIPHLAVAVNKMDLREYAEPVFEGIKKNFSEFAQRLGFRDVTFIPISAREGDNVVHRSTRMPWYPGQTLLEFLETVPIALDRNHSDFRYPVQYVIRPHLDYRGFAAEISSGVVRRDDPILVLPSRRRTRVRAIDTFEGEIESAFAPMSVTLRLADEVDVSRGDMLVPPSNVPHVGREIDAMIVWLSERPLDREKSYYLKHTTQLVRAEVQSVEFVINLETLEHERAESLELNDIGRAKVRCHRPIYFDAYTRNRSTGAFVLVDSITNNTVAAGMIIEPEGNAAEREAAPGRARSQVSPRERRERLGQSGATVFLTGLPASGKTDLAYALERRLYDLGRVAMVVDPADELSDLLLPPKILAAREDFLEGGRAASEASEGRGGTERPPAAEGRARNDELSGVTPSYVRQMARRNVEAGLITIFAFASPSRAERNAVRALLPEGRFLEVYVSTPPEACKERDQRGAYTADPAPQHEPPEEPAVTISLAEMEPESAAERIIEVLEARGLFASS